MEIVRVLLVEDNPVDALCLQEALDASNGGKFAVSHVETLAEAKECLPKNNFSLLVLDLGLPDSQGIGTFWEVKESSPEVPVVVLSGLDEEALAIQAIGEAAQDYLYKENPCNGRPPHMLSHPDILQSCKFSPFYSRQLCRKPGLGIRVCEATHLGIAVCSGLYSGTHGDNHVVVGRRFPT